MEENTRTEVANVTTETTTEQKKRHLPKWAKTALKVGAGLLAGCGLTYLMMKKRDSDVEYVDDPYDGYPMSTSDDPDH